MKKIIKFLRVFIFIGWLPSLFAATLSEDPPSFSLKNLIKSKFQSVKKKTQFGSSLEQFFKEEALPSESRSKFFSLFPPSLSSEEQDAILKSIKEYKKSYINRLWREPEYGKFETDFSLVVTEASQLAQRISSWQSLRYSREISSFFDLEKSRVSNFPY